MKLATPPEEIKLPNGPTVLLYEDGKHLLVTRKMKRDAVRATKKGGKGYTKRRAA